MPLDSMEHWIYSFVDPGNSWYLWPAADRRTKIDISEAD